MDKRQEIESIASRYDLDVDFVQQLHDKVTDKENFARAVKMFVDGTLPFAVATGDAPINVAHIRHDVAVNLLALRKTRADKVKEQMETQRRIVEYYNGCRHVTMTHKGNKSIRETVFIKDGLIVAFGHFEPKQGGIYSANNPGDAGFPLATARCVGSFAQAGQRLLSQGQKGGDRFIARMV